MTALFYIILVAVSPDITFSWIWLVVSIIISTMSYDWRKPKTIYRYINDPSYEGVEVEK